jgi:hypothetical protein
MFTMGSDEGHEAHESGAVAEICRMEWVSMFSSDIARCIMPVGI